MVFVVFHFPYNIADRLVNWDLAFSVHEDRGANQALDLSPLESDLRFQLKTKN